MLFQRLSALIALYRKETQGGLIVIFKSGMVSRTSGYSERKVVMGLVLEALFRSLARSPTNTTAIKVGITDFNLYRCRNGYKVLVYFPGDECYISH